MFSAIIRRFFWASYSSLGHGACRDVNVFGMGIKLTLQGPLVFFPVGARGWQILPGKRVAAAGWHSACTGMSPSILNTDERLFMA